MQPISTQDFRRVGPDVEKKCISYDVSGQEHVEWVRTTREAVKDFGINISNTAYYDKYVIVPQNTGYREVIGSCINLYCPLPALPDRGVFPTWEALINRIFQAQAPMFWDYLTILFRFPLQILPVLCLVSKENGTGKTTLANALELLFGDNVGIFGQDDLNSPFNVWIKCLVAVFEEISETKRSLNKIKSISTAKIATLNEKFKPQVSFRPFVKIIILSNNEDTFISANQEDTRYWIVKLKPLAPEDFDPDFCQKLQKEAPYVLYYLQTRPISTECRSRMWFAPEDIKTEALTNVRQESRSACAKDIEIWAQEIGKNFMKTEQEIYEALDRRYTRYEIRTALKKELHCTNDLRRYRDSMGNKVVGRPYVLLYGDDCPPSPRDPSYDENCNGL